MTAHAAAVLESVMHLPLADRAEVWEILTTSFNQKDTATEAKWQVEAENRLDAYLDGKLGCSSREETLRHVRGLCK